VIAAAPAWYVVHTHPHAEAKAAAHLTRQGYSVYLPRYLTRRRHARRVDAVAKPLFPRYLFVAIDRLAQRWRAIRSTVGVAHLVCHGEQPAVLPHAIIDDLLRRQNETGFVQLDLRPAFSRGDKVRIVDGVFAASLGLFDGMTDRERVAVLLNLLGREVRVVLDSDAIAAA
jgi:transcriptional antiterminator RfaH